MRVTPAQLDTTFGPAWSEPGLFYAYEPALRFELAIGAHPIDRFLSAYERAAAIASNVLSGADDLALAISFCADSERPGATALLRVCRGLRACGLPAPSRPAVRVRPGDQSVGDGLAVFEFAVTIGPEAIARVLWAAIGHDLGVRPTVSARLYLASLSRGVLLHPYDDRGMDLVGTSVAAIRPFYDRFRDWLLDRDQEKMTRLFGT